MNCPTCSKDLEDGLAFCPHCDAVLDQSVLAPEADAAEDDAPLDPPAGQGSPRRPAPGPRRPAPAPGPRRPAPPAPRASPRASAPSAPSAPPGYRSPEPAAPRAAAASFAASASDTGEVSAPIAELDALLQSFRDLAFEERLTAAGAVALVLVNLLPWRSTIQTDDFGFATWGALTALLGLATLFLVWVRVSGAIKAIPRRWVPQLQLAAAIAAGLVALAFIATNFERKEVWGRAIYICRPAAGAFLAIGAAVAQGLGAYLMSLRADR